jgi:small subunit ribosomal protein S6
MQFQADGDAINPFEVELKRDEKVMRFLTMKMDKDHFEYAEKRRTKLKTA